MQRILFVIFLSTAAPCSYYDTRKSGRRAIPSKGRRVLSSLPSPFLKISCLEYSGVVSDFMLLRALVFIGKNIEKDAHLKLKKWEWEGFAALLQAVTDLDPYFFDPYYFGNAFLTWYAGMASEANSLLEKGMRFRNWDWVPPFFIGFNYFFFLHDNDNDGKISHGCCTKAWSKPNHRQPCIEICI